MRHLLRLAITVAIVCMMMLNPATGYNSAGSKNEPGNPPNNIHLVTLDGAPHNRGLQHGRTLKKEINELITAWKTSLRENYKADPDTFISAFFKKTDFKPAINKWTPDLLEEVRGIAEGAEIDFNTMLLFQLPDEEWVNAADVVADRCSGIGFNKRGNSPALAAQNMDIPGFYNGYQTLLRIKQKGSDLESFVFTAAGLIALNGVNNKSVSVCANTLSQLKHSTDGLPVAFIIRGILAQKSQKDAVNFLQSVKHASGQNYIIGGPEKVYDFECSANKVAEFIPYKDAEVVYHTNHPLANDDYTSDYRNFLARVDASKMATRNSFVRFQSLETRLKDKSQDLSVAVAKAILTSKDSQLHPVCVPWRNKLGSFTFGSTIMVLSNKPEIIIAPGPPDATPYVRFSFSDKSEVAEK